MAVDKKTKVTVLKGLKEGIISKEEAKNIIDSGWNGMPLFWVTKPEVKEEISRRDALEKLGLLPKIRFI